MITKSPTLKNQFNKAVYFTKSARVAFSYILKLLDFKQNETLLIPSYIGYTQKEGSGVLDPIKANNVNFSFYPIERDFGINLIELEKKLVKSSVKAVLLIHYFGFCHCDLLQIKKICKDNDVFLIEDCAHTLYTKYHNKYLGEFGDFSFYSLHKVLPTNIGGMLKINNLQYQEHEIMIQEADKATYETLEIFSQYNEQNSKQKVLKNYRYMSKELQNIDGIEVLFPNIDSSTYPMNLPVYIHKMKREEFYFKMIEQEVTLIALYYQLIDEIQKEAYPDSFWISDRIINFPINQDIDLIEIKKIITLTSNILSKGMHGR